MSTRSRREPEDNADFITHAEAKELIDQAVHAAFLMRQSEQKSLAVEAVKETLKHLGIFFSEPGEIKTMRETLDYARRQMETSKKLSMHAKSVVIGMAVAGAVAAFIVGLISKINGGN